MHRFLAITALLFPTLLTAQASFTAMGTPYTQNFNSLPNTPDGSNATWTQNTTLPGWYIDEGNGGTCGGTACDDTPTIEASYTTLNNGGNTYIYASGSDRSIGSRAAGSTGTDYFGLRITNNTGSTITSVYVEYYGEQWSIAENQTNVNTIAFSYQVGSSMTSLTAGTWTTVPALDFTQIYTSAQSAGMGGSACGGTSAQCLALDGNANANRIHLQGCISVNITAGQEIMLRWTDSNDPANDHHLQIDDVIVYPFDVSCAIVLPVEWLSFTAEREGQSSLLTWETASENNNDHFVVERMHAGGQFTSIGTVDGYGTTSQSHRYTFIDEFPYEGVNYYRLRQVDFNGQSEYSVIRSVSFEEESQFTAGTHFDGSLQFYQSGNIGVTNITVSCEDGRIISSTSTADSNGQLEMPTSCGIYFIRFENDAGIIVTKQLILL